MNKRPFANCDEMWEHFKKDWNSKVGPDDYVFVLGDVLWGGRGGLGRRPARSPSGS